MNSLNLNSQVCTIKPNQNNDINADFVYDPLSELTYEQQLKIFFKDKVHYAFNEEAMCINYKTRILTFLGEDPVDISTGAAWKNIFSNPYNTVAELQTALQNVISTAISYENSLLSDSQYALYAGTFDGNIYVINFDADSRQMVIGFNVFFINTGVTNMISIGAAFHQQNLNYKQIYKVMAQHDK